MTNTSTFSPTHKITLNGREILVQVCTDGGLDGPAYTEQEWNTGTSADWSLELVRTEDDCLVAQFLFQGQVPVGVYSYETIRG